MKKITKTASVMALALLAGACDEGLTDVNNNPNLPTTATPELLFPQGVTATVGLIRGATFDLTFASLWAQHFAKIQYTDEDRYSIRVDTNEGLWSAFYSGGLQDFKTTIAKAQEAKAPNLEGPPLVMRSWVFGAMTDTWGDIPYSEANQGDAATPNITPKYDRQQDVYAGMLADLKRANDIMTGSGRSYGTKDPIYAGNATKWKRLANSLRLRYALRMSKVDPTRARAEAAAAFAAGVMQDNSDNAKLTWTADTRANENPIFNNFRTRDDHRISKTIVDKLKSFNDPRLAVYARPAADTKEFTGVPNGLTNADAVGLGLSKTSKIGTFFTSQTAPSWIMNVAEVKFSLAEAAERGWISGSAKTFYDQGITLSMQSFGIADAAIATYLAQPSVAYKGGAAGLEQIGTQKWIALFGQGIEAWSEWRRTGFPTDIRVAAAPVGVNQVPRRLVYPGSEQSFNKANLDAAIAAMGGDALTTRVWWDRP